ncbi:MAG: threonylcarbamoyl-AMP synthase [Clostridia bacterium]|nr:threonylcarbamoyl-AMP synthase [Clostridia bacterium]
MKTEIVKIENIEAERERAALQRAGILLRQGGLVVFPTETVYGLGADATDANAAKKIYAAKGRPSDNPLIVHVAAPEDAEQYASVPPLYWRLAETFMPGPLTVIMPVKESIPKTVTAGLSTVAIRCPSHPVAHALLLAAGVPIAAPSANLSGSPSPTCAAHVIDDMNGRVDMILDGGDCDIGVESTIVKIEPDETLTLLRPGGITQEMLEAVAGKIQIAEAVLGSLPEGAVALSPGMKYRHYAPRAPLFLLDGTAAQMADYIKQQTGRVAMLCYEEERTIFETFLKADRCFSLGERKNRKRQAQRLFFLLREIDKLNFDAIYAPLPPTDDIGMALYNRMIRAAAHHIVHLQEGM